MGRGGAVGAKRSLKHRRKAVDVRKGRRGNERRALTVTRRTGRTTHDCTMLKVRGAEFLVWKVLPAALAEFAGLFGCAAT